MLNSCNVSLRVMIRFFQVLAPTKAERPPLNSCTISSKCVRHLHASCFFMLDGARVAYVFTRNIFLYRRRSFQPGRHPMFRAPYVFPLVQGHRETVSRLGVWRHRHLDGPVGPGSHDVRPACRMGGTNFPFVAGAWHGSRIALVCMLSDRSSPRRMAPQLFVGQHET